jgi:predicted heme/steroid binding protein
MRSTTSNRRISTVFQLGALVLVVVAAMLVTSCAGSSATPTPTTSASAKTFTATELVQYDGQNGQPAYVAISGKVYDVSAIAQWKGGKHQGMTAGKDITAAFEGQSPHTLAFIKAVPVVGTYSG